MRLVMLRSRFAVLRLRLRVFMGLQLFGLGISIGGNDSPIWWTGHPLSNTAQTFVVVLFVSAGAWILSAVVQEFWV